MNERFLEFAKQAGLYDEKTPEEVPGFTASFEKFAELIVKECMDITEDCLSDNTMFALNGAEIIAEHFGIEE